MDGFASKIVLVLKTWRQRADQFFEQLDWESYQSEKMYDGVDQAHQTGRLKAEHYFRMEFLLERLETKKRIAELADVDPGTVTRWFQQGILGPRNEYPRLHEFLDKHDSKIGRFPKDVRDAMTFSEALLSIPMLPWIDDEPINAELTVEQSILLVELFTRMELVDRLIVSVDSNCGDLKEVCLAIATIDWADNFYIRSNYAIATTLIDFYKPMLLYIHSVNSPFLRGATPFLRGGDDE